MTIESITAASAAAQQTQRATLVMGKVLRIQREQADAMLALIEQASAPGPAKGRLIDVRV
jgi:hypothetical protein